MWRSHLFWARNSFLKVKHFVLVLIKKRSWWLLHKANPFLRLLHKENPFWWLLHEENPLWWLLHKENPFWWLLHINTTQITWVFISAPLQKRRSATHCNTLPHTATYQFDTHFTLVLIWRSREKGIFLWRSLLLFRQRDTLQHAATRCNTLQHTATHQLRISLWRSHLLLRKKDTLATHCDTMQQTATHCNPPPQHTNPEFLCGGSIYFSAKETRCNTLQHTATYCNTPKRSFFVEESSAPPQKRHTCDTLWHTVTHYTIPHHTTATHQFGVSWWRSHLLLRKRDTLQHTATHCNTLQHTATYCNILQHNSSVSLWRSHLLLRRRVTTQKFVGNIFSYWVEQFKWELSYSFAKESHTLVHMNSIWNKSSIYVSWPFHEIYVKRIISMCDMTHSYVWHDALLCLILLCT